MRVGEWTGKLGFVAAGLGVTLVPALATQGMRPDLVLRPIARRAPRRTVFAALPRRRPARSAGTGASARGGCWENGRMHDAFAHVAGRLATGLSDVATDLAALDSGGWWAVVVEFEGKVTLARFDDVRPAPLPAPGARGSARAVRSGARPSIRRGTKRASGPSARTSSGGRSTRPTCAGC